MRKFIHNTKQINIEKSDPNEDIKWEIWKKSTAKASNNDIEWIHEFALAARVL